MISRRVLASAALVLGCSGVPAVDDAGRTRDSGSREDSGAIDGGGADSGGIDGGAVDSGGIDGGAVDGGERDDAGPPLDCTGLQESTWAGLELDSTERGVEASNIFVPGEWAYDLHYMPGSSVRSDAAHAREPGTASIRSYISPRVPIPPGVEYDANFRAEIARRPWHEVVPLGTELWIGFSYYLPSTYVQDTANRATLFQLHAGRHHPPIEIGHWVPIDYHGAHGTQLHVIRRWGGWNTLTFDRQTLPVTFEPGQWYDLVVHVVWDVDGGTRGLTELWVNGTRHYSAEGGNTFSAGTDDGDAMLPYGGTPKLGWYKWPWHDAPEVDASEAAGVTELEMYIGAVRLLRRAEGEHIGEQGYECVAPRGARPAGPMP